MFGEQLGQLGNVRRYASRLILCQHPGYVGVIRILNRLDFDLGVLSSASISSSTTAAVD